MKEMILVFFTLFMFLSVNNLHSDPGITIEIDIFIDGPSEPGKPEIH